MTRPESIAGGCLCGAIRFKITFPKEEDWPPQSNGICQCTMCRKHSGSLLPQCCGFPWANITPHFASNPAYKTYSSSVHVYRGFCGTCGSALTCNEKSTPDIVEINLGAFDEDVLCGTRDEEKAWEDEYGRHVPRTGGVGKELCYPRYHLFWENAIPGVTDDFAGKKYLQDRAKGEAFTG
ncbi:hypothetical protein K491DRAFT_696448 [Lophiostoma macrostomum CBS 122681]|uniref:CENP-V/GFA domain-containing protein n=1 Tax=Lophiostoma macrostomum CBS 122681 TaxID=1314788 RepID=A0A6A6SUM6_9PLEO|nr:hypothetical protein K491DRAFT_696448 [Lophiostoma macrostomum CBS 122681]